MAYNSMGKVVFFVTSNINKFLEAKRIVAKCRIVLAMLNIEKVEIQSDSLEEIAKTCAEQVYKTCRLPVIVEDSGLFVPALNGFPGPYSSYVHQKLGNKGLLQLLSESQTRRAEFHSVVAFYSKGMVSPMLFKGKTTGELSKSEIKHVQKGFGFDPIFKPMENRDKTFAEMSVEEKNIYSHRGNAIRKFVDWYCKIRGRSDQLK